MLTSLKWMTNMSGGKFRSMSFNFRKDAVKIALIPHLRWYDLLVDMETIRIQPPDSAVCWTRISSFGWTLTALVGSMLLSNLSLVLHQGLADWEFWSFACCYLHASKAACKFLRCVQYSHIFPGRKIPYLSSFDCIEDYRASCTVAVCVFTHISPTNSISWP